MHRAGRDILLRFSDLTQNVERIQRLLGRVCKKLGVGDVGKRGLLRVSITFYEKYKTNIDEFLEIAKRLDFVCDI